MNGIEHFIRLARIGKSNPRASSGEKRACRLAQCMLDNLPGLDEDALAGAQDFMQIVQHHPESARDLIEAPSPRDLIEAPSPLGRRRPS